MLPQGPSSPLERADKKGADAEKSKRDVPEGIALFMLCRTVFWSDHSRRRLILSAGLEIDVDGPQPPTSET